MLPVHYAAGTVDLSSDQASSTFLKEKSPWQKNDKRVQVQKDCGKLKTTGGITAIIDLVLSHVQESGRQGCISTRNQRQVKNE